MRRTIHGWSADRRCIFAAPKSNASPSAVPRNSGTAGKSVNDIVWSVCRIADVSWENGIEINGIHENVISEISYQVKWLTASAKYCFATENLLGGISVAAIESDTSSIICTGVDFWICTVLPLTKPRCTGSKTTQTRTNPTEILVSQYVVWESFVEGKINFGLKFL